MSQIKNFVLKKLGIRAPAPASSSGTSKDKDNSLSASIKSNGSGGSSGGSRSKRKDGSIGGVESLTQHETGDGNNGEHSDPLSTKLQLSNELTSSIDQLPMTIGNEPIPIPRRKSPNIQFSEKTKFHSSEKSIMSSSEKSMVSDVLSDDSSVCLLYTSPSPRDS